MNGKFHQLLLFFIVLMVFLAGCSEPEFKTYQILYDLNGGFGDKPNAMTKVADEIILVHSLPNAVKSGHDFKFWNTEADGNGVTYAPGAKYITNSDVTLYAQWRVCEYTVSFSPNGGINSLESQKKSYGINLELTSEEPIRTGYLFIGWNVEQDGSGASYNAGSFYLEDSDLTLFAQWAFSDFSTVSYDANGGSEAPLPQTKIHDVVLTLASEIPSRTGYAFTGWNTAKNGTGEIYSLGAEYSANEDITLYAQWIVNIFFTITYDGKGGNGAPSSQEKPFDEAISLSSDQPSREKYSFSAWNTAYDGSGESYSPGDTYSENFNVTLFAQWVKIPEPVYHIIKCVSDSLTPIYYHYPRSKYIDENNFYYCSIISNDDKSSYKLESQINNGRCEYIKTTTQRKPENDSEPIIIWMKYYYDDLQNTCRVETFQDESLILFTEYEYNNDFPKFTVMKSMTDNFVHPDLAGEIYSVMWSNPIYNTDGYYIDSHNSLSEDWTRLYFSSNGKLFKAELFSKVDGSFVHNYTTNYYHIDDFITASLGYYSNFMEQVNPETHEAPSFSQKLDNDEITVYMTAKSKKVGFTDMNHEYVFSKSFLTD